MLSVKKCALWLKTCPVLFIRERVEEASRRAKMEYKEMEEKKRVGKRKHLNADNNFDDSENFVGVRKRELPHDMTSAKAWAFLDPQSCICYSFPG